MITVEGLFGISAKVLLNSLSRCGVRLITFELTYPRIIHSEFMTHRMLSKNAASSRAIPFNKMKEQLTGRPVRFGQANPGMQDRGSDFNEPVFVHRLMVEAFRHWLVNFVPTEEHNTQWCEEDNGYYTSPENWWKFSGWLATGCSQMFYEAGYAKQIYNRPTESQQMMKVVCSGTELSNFYWLRDDGAADPTIAELARVMKQAQYESAGMILYPGEYHLPYVGRYRDEDGVLHYGDDITCEGHVVDGIEYSLEDAIKVSAARCAAISFRNIDYDLKKCLEVHERLVGDERKHASALEHQSSPMDKLYPRVYFNGGGDVEAKSYIPDGVSHISLEDGSAWSGNFKGWIQYRKLIPGENHAEYN